MKIDLTQASIGPLLEYFEKIIPQSQEEKKWVTESFQSHL